jgi:DHA1 family bicyclomycin/chloramphenicol resistance-like MFS transporter
MGPKPTKAEGAARAVALDLPPYLILFIGALVAIGPLSLDAYLPAMPAMAEAFGVGTVQINNTISVYLVGYGVGQFFGGAFSDQVGRKRVGLIGLTTFMLASILIALATTVSQVQALRFVQAIGGGFSTVICMAIVRDVYPIDQLGKRMSMVMLVMLASPLCAPAIGAMLLRFGWPFIFLFKAVYAALLCAYYLFRVPETRPGSWRRLSISSMLRQCADVVTRKSPNGLRPALFPLCVGFAASVFMTFLTNSSFVYIDYFDVPAAHFPIYFAFSLVGLVAVNLYSMKRMTLSRAPFLFRFGLAVQFVALTTLLIVVLSGPSSIWLVVAIIAVMVATFGLTGPAGSAQYMSHFHELAGSASSLYTTSMFAMGAIFGAASGVFFDGTLVPMVVTMTIASVVANLVSLGVRPRGSASTEQSLG